MAKFKAGDTAKFKYHRLARLFILEVMEQTCYANVAQTWYGGRVFYSERQSVIRGEIIKVSDIELESLPQVSLALSQTVELWKNAKEKKEGLIKQQKFEEAALERDKERKLRVNLEMQADLEGLSFDEAVGN